MTELHVSRETAELWSNEHTIDPDGTVRLVVQESYDAAHDRMSGNSNIQSDPADIQMIGFGRHCCFLVPSNTFLSVMIKPTILTQNAVRGTFIVRDPCRSWDFIPQEQSLLCCDGPDRPPLGQEGVDFAYGKNGICFSCPVHGVQGPQGRNGVDYMMIRGTMYTAPLPRRHFNRYDPPTVHTLPRPNGQEGVDFIRIPNGSFYMYSSTGYRDGRSGIDHIYKYDKSRYFVRRCNDPPPESEIVEKNGNYYVKCNPFCETFQTIALECTLSKFSTNCPTVETETVWFALKYSTNKQLDESMLETCCLAIALSTCEGAFVSIRQSIASPQIRLHCKTKMTDLHCSNEPCVAATQYILEPCEEIFKTPTSQELVNIDCRGTVLTIPGHVVSGIPFFDAARSFHNAISCEPPVAIPVRQTLFLDEDPRLVIPLLLQRRLASNWLKRNEIKQFLEISDFFEHLEFERANITSQHDSSFFYNHVQGTFMKKKEDECYNLLELVHVESNHVLAHVWVQLTFQLRRNGDPWLQTVF